MFPEVFINSVTYYKVYGRIHDDEQVVQMKEHIEHYWHVVSEKDKVFQIVVKEGALAKVLFHFLMNCISEGQ